MVSRIVLRRFWMIVAARRRRARSRCVQNGNAIISMRVRVLCTQRHSLRNHILQSWQFAAATGGKSRGCRDATGNALRFTLTFAEPLWPGNVDGACYVHAVRQTRPLMRAYEHGGVRAQARAYERPCACSRACSMSSRVSRRAAVCHAS